MRNRIKLVAVVVTYNRLEHLKKTLTRLEGEPCDQIVVVDNNSTDGTASWLKENACNRLAPLFLERNLGGAGGFEAGMRYASETFQPDWMVLLDDDARPSPGAFDRFREIIAKDESWAAIAAAVYYPSGDICPMNRPSRNPFWSPSAFWRSLLYGRAGFHLHDEDFSEVGILPIDAASFVGFFVSKATISEVGFPNPALFLYGDDVLYSLKIRKHGGKIGFASPICFEHDCETLSPVGDLIHPLWKLYYYRRNQMLAYRSAAGVWFWLVLLVILPHWYLAGFKYGTKRRIYHKILFVALKDALSRNLSTSLNDIKRLSEES